MSASGSAATSTNASMASEIGRDAGASPPFPPSVALHIVKIACERPDTLGRSLSQRDCAEIARQLIRDGVVATISPGTVRQTLLGHRLKPGSTPLNRDLGGRGWKDAGPPSIPPGMVAKP